MSKNKTVLDYILNKIFKDEEKKKIIRREVDLDIMWSAVGLITAVIIGIIYLIFGDIF